MNNLGNPPLNSFGMGPKAAAPQQVVYPPLAHQPPPPPVQTQLPQPPKAPAPQPMNDGSIPLTQTEQHRFLDDIRALIKEELSTTLTKQC
jgi:hypothetical protein